VTVISELEVTMMVVAGVPVTIGVVV
jgi:hypothetical protein